MTNTTDKDADACPDPDLLALMTAGGFRTIETWQFVPCTSNGPTVDKAELARKKAAERQAAKAKKDTNDQWARCYAKAPNDEDARMIVSAVAKAIVAPEIRMAIRLALANPGSVFVGEKVRGLSGLRAIATRALLGTIDMPNPSGGPLPSAS